MNQQVHLIVGNDDFLTERAQRAITAEIAGDGETSVTAMNASEVTSGELMELLSPSLFSDDRIVVLKGAENVGKDTADLLLQAAADPGPGIYLIITHSGGGRQKALVGKLAKFAQRHDANAPKKSALPSWVAGEFRSLGVRVDQDVIESLLEGVGSDLRELASAIHQLVDDTAATGARITESTVRAYYSGVAEVSSFDIADWAVAGQRARALAGTRRALQLGMSPVAVAAALSMKVGMIARLYSTNPSTNTGALAGELGAHPFVIEKTLRVAKNWRGEAVSEAVILMAELDAAVKGQGGDPNYELEAAVNAIAKLAS